MWCSDGQERQAPERQAVEYATYIKRLIEYRGDKAKEDQEAEEEVGMFLRTYDPLPVETDIFESSLSDLSTAVRGLFRSEAPREISRQVRRHMERRGVVPPVNEVLRDIEFSGWKSLIAPATRALATVSRASGITALDRIGVGPSASEGSRVAQYAVTFAKARAAEMVGMRVGPDGSMVVNPRAEFAITDSTRDMLRDMVQTALKQGWDADRLTSELKRIHAFSPERAEVIARTELAMAHNKGAFVAYKTAGNITGVRWVTKRDDRVEEICLQNESAGVVPIGSKFPSGHTHPLAHPRCRCKLSAVSER